VLVPELTLAGLHAKVETSVRAARFTVTAWVVPFSAAVIVTDCPVVKVPAVAVNAAELVPAATVTEAGMVSRELLSARVTSAPPAGAWLRLTVQVVEAPEARVAGLHVTAETLSGKAVMVPPVAVMATAPPDWVAPIAFVIPSETEAAMDEIVTDTDATTPFGIGFSFRPLALSPVKKQL
jgi:hypothetical protein